MHRARPWRWALIAIAGVCAGFSASLAACGSDSFTAPVSTDDGGADADVSRDSGAVADATPSDTDACIKAPTTVLPGQGGFCAAFASIATRCLECGDECRIANANACDQFGAAISDPFRKGIVACQDQIKCSEFEDQGLMASNPCVTAWIIDGGVTPDQLNARNTYCGKCADGGGGVNGTGDALCANYFQSLDGSVGALGGFVLVVSDSVAQKITAGCGSCDSSYALCTLYGFCTNSPKDQCHTGICK